MIIRVNEHPAFANLTIPFNRIDISGQIALLLPCYRYNVDPKYQGGSMHFSVEGVTYSMPITILCDLTREFRQCLSTASLNRMFVRQVQVRLDALEIQVKVIGFAELTFLNEGA